ncbi:hypothetical protein [Fusobacterium sp. MFO224]|uniref:hypothetical protein n=1 Tax=Fusobacterium sp. MFO224 TaxID=3378070 RepID=UPI0038553482
MKNKNMYLLISGIILVLGCTYFFNNIKVYYLVNKGNKYYHGKEYEKADKYYEKAFVIRKSEIIKNNLIVNDYQAKKYSEVLKRKGNKDFLNGNSLVKLSEQEKNEEKLKESLECYKKEMLKNSDMNIKKNYEIILKEINQSQKNNQDQKNQQKEQNKENKNQNQNNQNQQDKDQGKNQQKQNKQNQSQQNQSQQNQSQQGAGNEKNKQDDKNKKNSDQKNNLNNNKQKEPNQGQNSEGEIRNKEEIKAVLKRLEGSEKQAFKNNERLMDITNNDDEDNRW